jgi:hypothetical protein
MRLNVVWVAQDTVRIAGPVAHRQMSNLRLGEDGPGVYVVDGVEELLALVARFDYVQRYGEDAPAERKQYGLHAAKHDLAAHGYEPEENA